MPGRAVPAALGPADDREEPYAFVVQPLTLRTGGEADIRLRPPPWPGILRAVECGAAQPVLPGKIVAVADANPALLGRVHEEQAAKRPERLAAQGGLGLLFEQDDAPSGGG